jgi:TDG/mug DNA glycosylase family protein
MNPRIHAFPPILGSDPRVLILGSMPSVESLKRGQYYGHPRNHFWPLMYRIFDAGEPPESYERRVAFLERRGVAVWDVISDCIREGSLDQSIEEAAYRDIGALLAAHPGIRLVAANGRRAHDGFRKALRLYGWLEGRATEEGKARAEGNAREEGKAPCRYIERFELTACRFPSTSPIPTRYAKRMEDKVEEWKLVAQYALEVSPGSGARSGYNSTEYISSERVTSTAEVNGSKKEEAQG